MALQFQVKSTAEFCPKPRAVIYSKPGEGKTTLAATVATPGKRDILLAVTEGGVQSIAHLDLPYIDVTSPKMFDDFTKSLAACKADPETGMIQWQGMDLSGVCFDLYSEVVATKFVKLCKEGPRAMKGDAEKLQDDPSQYEYKVLNMQIAREMRALRALPLKYVLFTAYAQDVKDTEGNVVNIRPRFVGQEIWQAVCGQVDYVFYLQSPASAKDAATRRLIRTQPTSVIFAKARVPSVAGVCPLEPEIKFPLGHQTMLAEMFDKGTEAIKNARALRPTIPVPSGVEAA